MMRTFRLMRLLVAVVVALGLSMAGGSLTSAQDDEESGQTVAENVRELVLNQREQVLDDIASIMAGGDERAESAETDADEAAEGEEAEDGEGEDGEPEDGEPEDGEPEDGEGEDEGVGGEDCELDPSGAVGAEAESAAVASDEAAVDASVDEATAGEEDNAESVGAEVVDAQPASGATDAPADQEVCSLPSTGTGSNSDTHNIMTVFAAFAAVVAAGFGLRQRFI